MLSDLALWALSSLSLSALNLLNNKFNVWYTFTIISKLFHLTTVVSEI